MYGLVHGCILIYGTEKQEFSLKLFLNIFIKVLRQKINVVYLYHSIFIFLTI